MATIKAYTDINQSKMLAEILPIESADMWYDNNGESIAGRPEVRYCSFVGLASMNIPCWSLAALFNILPLKIEDVYSDYELKIDMIDKMPRYVLYGDCYHDSFPWDFEKEDLLDNVVESIVWLHNNNYLSK